MYFSAGYDVQSASTPDGVLYITGAPRYNHTGRVVVYRLNQTNNVVVSQILKGEQVSLFQFGVLFLSVFLQRFFLILQDSVHILS